ncbi:MAG TPA: methyltransferase domain-containing protein, partial [Planctomycetota bacterium]|nr:methyltransferase domain-containing protein [Planctomycetota bacterium]
TRCGMRRVMCTSHIDVFELHHLPNVYIGKTRIPVEIFREQIRALEEIQDDPAKHGTLFDPRTGLVSEVWDKQYYEPVRQDVLELVPKTARRILSVGAGWGATELALAERGAELTLIPMDWVIATPAESAGLRVLPPDFDQSLALLEGETFDTILFLNVVQYLENPDSVLRKFRPHLSEDGRYVLTAPNFSQIGLLRRRWKKPAEAPDLRVVGDFAKSRLQHTSRRTLTGWLRNSGLSPVDLRWRIVGASRRVAERTRGIFNDWLAQELVLAAESHNGG